MIDRPGAWQVVTPRELFYILLIAVFPTEILFLPSTLIDHFGKDALWCEALGGALGLAFAWGVAWTKSRLRDTTVEDYLIGRFGFLGRVALFAFAVVLLVPTCNIMAAYVQVTGAEILPHTPLYVLTLSSALVAVYMVVGGLELVGRLGLFVVPISLFLMVLLFLMAFPWYNLLYIQPALPVHGLSLVHGVYRAFAFLAETAFALLIPTKASTRLVGPVLLSAGVNWTVLVLMTAMPLLMFGPDVAPMLTSPVLSAIRTIHYGVIIERMDVVIAPLWVALSLLKFTLWVVMGTRLVCAAFGLWAVQRILARLVVVAASVSSLTLTTFSAVTRALDVTWYHSLLIMLVVLSALVSLAASRRTVNPDAPL